MKDYSFLIAKVAALKTKVELNSITPALLGAVLDDFIAMMKEIDMTDLRPPYTSLFSDVATALSIARAAMAKAEANETAIDSVLGEGATEAIENFAEILSFLAGCRDDETLQGLLNKLRTSIANVQKYVDEVGADLLSLKHLPFDGIVYKTSEARSKTPGTVWFSKEDCIFVVVDSSGGLSADAAYNSAATGPKPKLARTDRVFVCGSSLYRAVPDEKGVMHLVAYVDERTTADLQAQIDTLTDVGDTRWTSAKTWAEENAAAITALDAKVAVEAFEGPLASDSGEGVWFDDGTGKFVVKAEDGTVSDGGAEYNWIPTPELVEIGAVAHARTDKVYRDREGGLWHVAYDAEAENYVLLAYVDESRLNSGLDSLGARLDTRIFALETAVEAAGIEAVAGTAMTLAQLSAAGRQAGVWFVKNTGLFYEKNASGEVEEADEAYNVFPTETETGLGATPHGRTDKLYRASDGALFRLVDREGVYVLTDYVDRLTLEATAASLEESATAQVTALRKATGVYPFDILVEHVNELETGASPGSIAYVIGSKIFYRKDSSGEWEPAGTDYNNAGGTGPTDNVFRFGNVLYVRSGFSGGLTSLVTNKDLTSCLASKAEKEELSNVLAGEAPAPGTVTLPDINTYTREELKKDLFIDMWNDAAKANPNNNYGRKKHGEYDPENAPDAQHPFRLYDVWLTYEEAVAIYNWRIADQRIPLAFAFSYYPWRAVMPLHRFRATESLDGVFSNAANLEYVAFYAQVSSAIGAFSGCRKLRKIDGPFSSSGLSAAKVDGMFRGCEALEEVRLYWFPSISFADSPNLSLASVEHYVANTSGSADKPKALTLHPTAYARVTDELFETAASKNITIASA